VGTGGDDVEENILQMCRNHHNYQHNHGWYKLSILCPSIVLVLEEKGFEFEDRFGVKKLVRKI